MRFFFSAVLGVSGLLIGCSSNGASPSTDAGPTTADGSAADGSSSDASNPTADSSTPVDAGPQCLVPGVTADQCRTCCGNAYPAGYQTFANLTLACACQPQFCGPPDGGIPDAGEDSGSSDAAADAADDAGTDAGAATGDGGLYGNAVCSAATCGMTEQPSPACNDCINNSLGTVANVGTCGNVVLAHCINDTDCWTFFGCAENCPNE